MVGFFCVREYHCHACRLRGDDERAKVFPKALDLGFGGLLLRGFSPFAQHTERPICASRCAPLKKCDGPVLSRSNHWALTRCFDADLVLGTDDFLKPMIVFRTDALFTSRHS